MRKIASFSAWTYRPHFRTTSIGFEYQTNCDFLRDYLQELAELVSASMTDTNKFPAKPDKNTILQETVNQINRITQEGKCSVNSLNLP